MNSFFSIIRKATACEMEKEFTKAFNLYFESEYYTTDLSSKIKIRAKMAWCQYSVGNPKETEFHFQYLLDNFSDHPLSYVLYSKYQIKLRKFKSAKLILKKGISLYPSFLEYYLLLASLLKDMDRSEESIEVLKIALAQENLTKSKGIGRKDIWSELGSLFYSRGDYNSALACLRKALKMGDESEFLNYELLSLCYLELEDPENALKSIEAFIEYIGEIDPEVLIIQSRAKCRLGLLDEAAQLLIQAYSYEDSLQLNGTEMTDFAPLLRNGFFTTLENIEWEEP